MHTCRYSQPWFGQAYQLANIILTLPTRPSGVSLAFLCMFICISFHKKSLSAGASLADLVQIHNLCRAHIYHLGGLFLTPLYHSSAELAERPCSKINDLRHCQMIRFEAAHPCAARNL